MGITIIGLGPGPADMLTAAARTALTNPQTRVFARTRLHPALAGFTRTIESFDAVYEEVGNFSDITTRIVERLKEAASDGDVVYAVPGDGVLGEAVAEALSASGTELRIMGGVSEGPMAIASAGVSAIQGGQIIDALALGMGGAASVEVNPRWPVVVTAVYNRAVAGEVKLALQSVYPESAPIIVVHHAGLEDQRVTRLSLDQLDRGRVALDHLTQVVIPPVATEDATGSPQGLRAIISRLRAPQVGCPWDLKQTHHSLIPYVLEEGYEVVEAIEDGAPSELMDELGDLLLQVMLHAEIADQEGDFEWNDVVRAISAKLIRRHPHVFGDVTAEGVEDVERNWDALKAGERTGDPPRTSALDGISKHLPALKQATEQSRKATKAGFSWVAREAAMAKVKEELRELLEAPTLEERREELGDVLWSLANLAALDGLDAELVLRQSITKFNLRFRHMEGQLRERGEGTFTDYSQGDLLKLWNEAKAAERTASKGALPPMSAAG